ncbi:S-adenosyl-L-methionine-dependent methyltransferase [Rhexocercosporidium sp. MPI-PUGE-AT-0058]|nr:S-adenosyl-L-methionine-dependent methyltransferase [Rhexocercosporidium sp. MPI-PUGE-AT-0058]
MASNSETSKSPCESAGHEHAIGTNKSLETAPFEDDLGEVSDGEGLISVDSQDDDSAIGDLSLPRSTTSVRSSVYDYVEEDGRTFHRYKEGSYVMPNDEREQERLDMQHQLWHMTLHSQLFLAPIAENPQHALDIGTGTGIWAIDFANRFPSAQVIGTDLSPIQPDFVPANCQFEVEDAEDEWTYSQKFDFVHGRLMISCFKDPRYVFEQAFKSLAPGGYLEMQDTDFPMKSVDDTLVGTDLWDWNQYIIEGSAKAGRPWTRVKEYKKWMEEIGFVDVEEKVLQWPTNTWPRDKHMKTLGMWFCHDLSEGLSSTRAVLTRGLGWSVEKAEAFLVNVRKDVRNRNVHAYVELRIVYGRKPPSA